ncbi:MAG: serine acetyltransferase [Clostridia bacterium]|nr:serine acetyltransferase [Clostridia bacterium]
MSNIENIAKSISKTYNEAGFPLFDKGLCLPDKNEIIEIIKDIQKLFFPSYFASISKKDALGFTEELVSSIYYRIKKQIELSLKCEDKGGKSKEIADKFISSLPEIHSLLVKDVYATLEGDPAASSKEEIIFSYPGFYAIFVYRVAHLLYLEGVMYIPRIMTEHAHSMTGIDINPGATIGEYFFIDHGTGIVIGETTNIGNHVKLYQGVTLGALSPRKGQSLSGIKRHPTVCDNVTIYSGASILGGETVIGEGAVIGGNCFITESVEAGSRVSVKKPEHIVKN